MRPRTVIALDTGEMIPSPVQTRSEKFASDMADCTLQQLAIDLQCNKRASTWSYMHREKHGGSLERRALITATLTTPLHILLDHFSTQVHLRSSKPCNYHQRSLGWNWNLALHCKVRQRTNKRESCQVAKLAVNRFPLVIPFEVFERLS